MGLFFGTDGIRGVACEEITNELAFRVGASLASLKKSAKILVGRDTRVSGQFLSLAFCEGAVSGGATVSDLQIAPTPAVAFLTQKLGYDYGVVISASHNSGEYNGIKVFDRFGHKLTDKEEERVEHPHSHLRKALWEHTQEAGGLAPRAGCSGSGGEDRV